VNNLLYSPDETAKLLSELSDVLGSDLSAEEAQILESMKLEAEDVASAPIQSRRILDFTAHMVKNFRKEVESE
jgi:hypothetical protein